MIRLFLVLLLWGFHLSLGIFLSIGLLSWICCVAWIGLLPDFCWSNRAIRQLEDWLRHLGQKLIISSVIAHWGKRVEAWGRNVYTVAPLIGIVFVFWLAGASASSNPQPRWLIDTASSMGLVQRWDMFAAMPFRDDGWLFVELRALSQSLGTYNLSGQKIDDWKQPVRYRGYRQKRLEHYLIEFKKYRQPALERFCHKDKRATQADLYLVSDLTPLPGEPQISPSKRAIESLHCPSSNNSLLTPEERTSIEFLGG